MGREFYPALRQEGLSQFEAEGRVEKSKRRIVDAPVAILLFLDRSEIDHYDDVVRDRGELTMAVQSTAIAGGYLLLAAAAEGLGGVWVCAPLFTPAALRETLELPETWEPQAILLLGHPVGSPPARSRRGPDEVVRIF
jgi:nitroreductase